MHLLYSPPSQNNKQQKQTKNKQNNKQKQQTKNKQKTNKKQTKNKKKQKQTKKIQRDLADDLPERKCTIAVSSDANSA